MPVYVIETKDGKTLPTPAFVVANKPQQAARVWAESQVQPRLASPLESLTAKESGAVILWATDPEGDEKPEPAAVPPTPSPAPVEGPMSMAVGTPLGYAVV